MKKKALSPIELYGRQMEEVKRRVAVAQHFLGSTGSAVYFQPAVESAALQIRKILERIAFGSLIANRNLCAKTYDNFSKTWNAKLLLNDLAKINVNYYPVPIKSGIKKKVDGTFVHESLGDGYLTPGEFRDAYELCNGLLHATNPYKTERDMQRMSQKLKAWLNQIVQLLNIHEVHFVDQRSIWVINMQEDNDEHVHFDDFEKITDNKN
ncbi:hypothetical protein NHH73_16785 [Oxalobacteraceae bacterium OTU3CINTB1]|nr:hypothetical protein NHH73_16785 [Oxalobacteraceae bacterium OTU3CINTB1]